MTLSPLSHTKEEEDIWNNKISNEKKKKEKEKKIKGTAKVPAPKVLLTQSTLTLVDHYGILKEMW